MRPHARPASPVTLPASEVAAALPASSLSSSVTQPARTVCQIMAHSRVLGMHAFVCPQPQQPSIGSGRTCSTYCMAFLCWKNPVHVSALSTGFAHRLRCPPPQC